MCNLQSDFGLLNVVGVNELFLISISIERITYFPNMYGIWNMLSRDHVRSKAIRMMCKYRNNDVPVIIRSTYFLKKYN